MSRHALTTSNPNSKGQTENLKRDTRNGGSSGRIGRVLKVSCFFFFCSGVLTGNMVANRYGFYDFWFFNLSGFMKSHHLWVSVHQALYQFGLSTSSGVERWHWFLLFSFFLVISDYLIGKVMNHLTIFKGFQIF
jgi:hypothetical protein